MLTAEAHISQGFHAARDVCGSEAIQWAKREGSFAISADVQANQNHHISKHPFYLGVAQMK